MKWIGPPELAGMPDVIRVNAEHIWIQRFKEFVRRGLNDKRNGIRQTLLPLITTAIADEAKGENAGPIVIPTDAATIEKLICGIP